MDEYADYVSHPRFGRRPRPTGSDPAPAPDGSVILHWHSPPAQRVPATAVAADLARQTAATVPVTHYFDVSVHGGERFNR